MKSQNRERMTLSTKTCEMSHGNTNTCFGCFMATCYQIIKQAQVSSKNESTLMEFNIYLIGVIDRQEIPRK